MRLHDSLKHKRLRHFINVDLLTYLLTTYLEQKLYQRRKQEIYLNVNVHDAPNAKGISRQLFDTGTVIAAYDTVLNSSGEACSLLYEVLHRDTYTNKVQQIQ